MEPALISTIFSGWDKHGGAVMIASRVPVRAMSARVYQVLRWLRGQLCLAARKGHDGQRRYWYDGRYLLVDVVRRIDPREAQVIPLSSRDTSSPLNEPILVQRRAA